MSGSDAAEGAWSTKGLTAGLSTGLNAGASAKSGTWLKSGLVAGVLSGIGGTDLSEPLRASKGFNTGVRFGLSCEVGLTMGFRKGLKAGKGIGWMAVGMRFVVGFNNGAVRGIARTGLLTIGAMAVALGTNGFNTGAKIGTEFSTRSGGDVSEFTAGAKFTVGVTTFKTGAAREGTRLGGTVVISTSWGNPVMAGAYTGVARGMALGIEAAGACSAKGERAGFTKGDA